MEDYSEVTCHLQRDVVNIINALNDKRWDEAYKLIYQLDEDARRLKLWVLPKVPLNDRNFVFDSPDSPAVYLVRI